MRNHFYDDESHTALEYELLQRIDDACDWFELALEIIYGIHPYDKEELQNALEECAHYVGARFPLSQIQLKQAI